jgi:hypothetical protein
MVALEVFFLKLKLLIHTGIAGGIFTLKLQQKNSGDRSPEFCISADFNHPHHILFLAY